MKERNQNNSCNNSPCTSPLGKPFKSVSVRTVWQIERKVLDAGYSLATKSGTAGLLETGGGGGGGFSAVGALLLLPPPHAARKAQLADDIKSSFTEFFISIPLFNLAPTQDE